MHAFLASCKSSEALRTDQVLFSYCPIERHNKLPQTSVACKNKHVFSHLRACGLLGLSRCRQAGLQAKAWVWVSSCISQTYTTSRLPALHSSHGDEKSQKGRGKPEGHTLQPLFRSHLLASCWPKLFTKPNRVAKGFGFVSVLPLLLMCVSSAKVSHFSALLCPVQ